MKLWITGCNGMLGSHFKELLTKKRIQFAATDKNEVDITRENQINDFVSHEKITHIINCAAYTHVDQAENEPEKAFEINAHAPRLLGKITKETDIKVIHFSTDYVFDGKNTTPHSEDCSCEPHGIYGQSKRLGEKYLLEENDNACIIRTSWLFGHPGKNFVGTILKLLQDKESLRVVNDQIGRPTYCQDLAEAALLLLNQTGIFHFANSNETNWYEFAQYILKEASGFELPLKCKQIEPVPTSEYPTTAKRPAYSVLDTTKFETFTGAKPRPWQEALSDYFTKAGYHALTTAN